MASNQPPETPKTCDQETQPTKPESSKKTPKIPLSGNLTSYSQYNVHDIFTTSETFRRGRMPRSPSWSVPWSDLMMTMFILFVVLYAYQSVKKEFLSPAGLGGYGMKTFDTPIMESGGSGLDNPIGPTNGFIEKMYNLSKQTLTDEKLQEFASVELVADKTVRIILTGDLLFDSGQTVLKENAKQSLTKVATILRQTNYAINVVGHTDNIPIHNENFLSNWDLSAIRASAVTRYLINKMKIPANQFYVSGHSHYQPRQSNDTVAGRAANRRVEIIISQDKPGSTSTVAIPPQTTRAL